MFVSSLSILNGSAQTNGHVNGEEEHDNDDAESVASSIEDVNEPGAGLGNTTTLESEDSEDELISLHDSQTLKVRLCLFCSNPFANNKYFMITGQS